MIALRVVQGGHEDLVVEAVPRVGQRIVLRERRGLVLVARDEALIVPPGGPMTGSSDIRTDTISSSGTYFARTTRQTVSGVASASPIGPQIHVQKATASRSATWDTPALWL